MRIKVRGSENWGGGKRIHVMHVNMLELYLFVAFACLMVLLRGPL